MKVPNELITNQPMKRRKLIGKPKSKLLRDGQSRKSGSVIVTAQMRANAVLNCKRYTWARKYRDRLIAQVKPFMAMSDEQLWMLLPSQEMPRDNSINRDGAGCPKCGKEHFNAPYNPSRWHWDMFKRPWKVQCRNCQEWFPQNDFGAYYESALDKRHKFRLGAGEKRFLAPEKGGNQAWVDDGTGVRINGHNWFFTAGYSFRLWRKMLDVTEDMAILYTLTNDAAYAHKAGVLLDRMADLYPEMDYEPFFIMGMEASTGGSGWGRVQGMIWECWTAQKLSKAYDYVYEALKEDQELAAFSKGMSGRFDTGDKSSPQKIIQHLEDHLLKEFIVGVLDRSVWGNVGMTEHSMAAVAIALDHPQISPRYLDWLFEPNGGKAPYILREVLCREGLSYEAGLGYCMSPGQGFYVVAEMLRKYGKYKKHDLYRDFPKFRNCFTMCAKVRAGDTFFPNWGDANKTMNYGNTGLTLPAPMALAGYRAYGTKEIAREVWFANGKKLSGIQLDVYDAEPEEILAQLKKDLAGSTPALESYNSGGYGCAFLQAQSRKDPRCVMMYYGRMSHHGHEDRLALQMISNNIVSIPDLGYPLYTGAYPKRMGWTSHVISHNTCMVNDKGPDRKRSYSGKTQLFEEIPPVRVVDVDGQGGKIYSGVRTYRRCLVMVDVNEDESYVVDIFWVRGGTNHRLIQNAGGPEVTHSGLALKKQAKGTYAGENVAFGEFYDGPKDWDYDGSGFMYLNRVEKGKPGGDFWVDWKLVEPRRKMPATWEAHLRVHNLTLVDEVALCDGIPPSYQGAPASLRYMLRSRFGQGLKTQFVSVIEPYGHKPFIASVRALENSISLKDAQAAIEIKLANGQRDVVIVTENGGHVEAGGVVMDGRVGFTRFGEGKVVCARLIEGTLLRADEVNLALKNAAVTGKLVSFDQSDVTNTRLKLDVSLPEDGIIGKYIIFANNRRSDASYRIEKVIDEHTVSIGCNSLVERLQSQHDYTKGMVYNINPGDSFRIAGAAGWGK